MAAKRKLGTAMTPEVEEPVDPADQLLFLCLGGGNEVGRSCHIIKYKGKTVMLDAGMHPAFDGISALPFFDEFDLSTVDILLISHFHIDHAASLPYVLSKTNFRGRIFMTHSTKAIYKWLIQDSVRVGNTASSSEQRTQLYTEADHLSTFPTIEAIDYYTTHTISSIRVTPYPAGHVLGAAMFLIEIAGIKILFTGDYSRENDRHLIPATAPKNTKIDILITESTYGISSHIPRLEREASLMKSITSILNRGGRALLPVFALGRAQELLLILDEYWSKHPEYQKIPIYYASNLARKCMVVYQTYIGAMNDNIKRLFRERMAEAEAAGSSNISQGGPWDFRHIRSLKSLERFEDVGGCVMLASPGMMQSGVSRELLERWAPDGKNGVVITGYSVEGTMAKIIATEPEQIPAVMTNRSGASGPGRGKLPGKEGEPVMIPRRCSVEEYSFAAHVDGQENREFIEEINAPHVILVHGERNNMTRLRSKLLGLNKNKPQHLKTKVYSPANCEALRITIHTEKTAKVVGKLAERLAPFHLHKDLDKPKDSDIDDGEDDKKRAKAMLEEHGTTVSGVLVQNDLKLSLMAPEDLREYAGLTTTTVTCRQKITLASASIELIRWALEGTFGGIVDLKPHSTARTNGAQTNGNAHPKQEDEEEADEELGPPMSTSSSTHKYLIMDTVTLTYRNHGELELEWEGNMMNDGIADAVMAVLLSVESSPSAVKQSSKLHGHAHGHSHDHDGETNTDGTNGDTDSKQPNGAIRPTKYDMRNEEQKNPHANLPPAQKLSRLMLFLESQFGAEAVAPIARPRIISSTPGALDTTKSSANGADIGSATEAKADVDTDTATSTAELEYTPEEKAELNRLHALGIPVPGLLIRVDQHEARVWLEDLSVECVSSRPLGERVRRVVERGVECVSGLYGGVDGVVGS